MKLTTALLTGLLASGTLHAADEAPIVLEQFFQKPSTTGASISPDGRHVALRKMSPEGRSMLMVLNVATRERKVVANFRNADVNHFYWLNDMRLAYTLGNVDYQGGIGKPGLYAVDRDGKGVTGLSYTINPPRSFTDSGDYASSAYLDQSSIHGFPPRKENEMFVIVVNDDQHTLARMNTRNGDFTDIRAPAGTYRWLTDPDSNVRVVVARRNGKDVVMIKPDDTWRELASFDPLAPDAFRPVLYLDGTLYVRAYRDKNEAAIYRYDLRKNAIDGTPVILVPGYDADGYFVLDDKKMLGYRINTDSETTVWFDADMKALQKEVDALLPGTLNTLSVGGHGETGYVVVDAHRDVQDHAYFLYQRGGKKLQSLGASRPELDPARMAPMLVERYAARDGLQVPLYVTLPARQDKKPAPTVVLIGDAAWQRSAYWEWNAEVQFLASRGYVVLQPQPRGTEGFGRAHVVAGAKQWGRAMQDDIADAVQWSVRQGYTDAARVCVVGGGYGGYAAMMALARDPAVFKCGVSWSGITDLEAMFRRNWDGSADERTLPRLRAAIGDPKLDAAQLREASPLHNAARIQQPVLLAYGKEDGRVPFSDGRKFYTALAAGNPRVQWLEYTPDVEDAKTQKNRIDLWRNIEAFLGKQIGRAAPGP
ncbi:prolyl oligopeptidase family serine peptidase [Duganella sp. FT94W]|uniref:Prolyl oligopeptidase family serine peptidase n=1 Tax=Duganella lactea TaxID=2692173 RepID=A0ABW9VEK0_9BURK|nr:prolyl oligopeptidase family serine peptidase [Duganella lactea]MYM37013.1 prolyl oligopeptidase family serine peptidase [Duganella lactea]